MRTPFAETYARPSFTALDGRVQALAAAAGAATDGDALVRVARDWNQLRLRIDQLREIARLRFFQDTRDAAARAEEEVWSVESPRLRAWDLAHARALLGSRFSDALDAAFGPQLRALLMCRRDTYAPEIADAVAEEAKLKIRYTDLLATEEVQFRGGKHSLSGIARWFGDADRGTRLEAQRARESFLAERGEELDDLYDKLVKLRDGMGRALGRDHFTPLGYALLGRTDYDASDVAAFREEVRREVVPLAVRIGAARARRLGLDKLLFHDELAGDPAGAPVPVGDAKRCIAQSHVLFAGLGSAFASFWEVMLEHQLLDLEMRPGKATAGFCTTFAEKGLPFVFINFNGSDGDIFTFTHECGHAFQMWKSREQPLLEYRYPTAEACEIHSMSMEFLAYPWMHLYFDAAGAERYRHMHLEARILALPYMAAVDHFQHEVYANPGLTPAERRARWREMERLYLPDRDYDELAYLASGTIWQRQQHLFNTPFYYIDYALAQTCALQMWRRAEEDRARAVDDYLAMCSPGGSVPFSELVARGRLRSPFEPGCLRDVVASAQQTLGV